MRRGTSAPLTLADLEQPVNLDLIDLELISLSAPALLGSGVTLWSDAQEVNASMTVNVVLIKLVLTTTADLLVRMHVVRMLNVKLGTTGQSVPVLLGLLEIP